jgi:hypothetical protein
VQLLDLDVIQADEAVPQATDAFDGNR